MVLPGKYTITMARRVSGTVTPLGAAQTFTVYVEAQNQMSPADRAALVEFQQKVARLQRAVTGALETANQLKTRLGLIKRALQETPAADYKLTEQAQAIERRLDDILRALRGDQTARSRNEDTPPAINDRVGTILSEERMSSSRPTPVPHTWVRRCAHPWCRCSRPSCPPRNGPRTATTSFGSETRTSSSIETARPTSLDKISRSR